MTYDNIAMMSHHCARGSAIIGSLSATSSRPARTILFVFDIVQMWIRFKYVYLIVSESIVERNSFRYLSPKALDIPTSGHLDCCYLNQWPHGRMVGLLVRLIDEFWGGCVVSGRMMSGVRSSEDDVYRQKETIGIEMPIPRWASIGVRLK